MGLPYIVVDRMVDANVSFRRKPTVTGVCPLVIRAKFPTLGTCLCSSGFLSGDASSSQTVLLAPATTLLCWCTHGPKLIQAHHYHTHLEIIPYHSKYMLTGLVFVVQ